MWPRATSARSTYSPGVIVVVPDPTVADRRDGCVILRRDVRRLRGEGHDSGAVRGIPQLAGGDGQHSPVGGQVDVDRGRVEAEDHVGVGAAVADEPGQVLHVAHGVVAEHRDVAEAEAGVVDIRGVERGLQVPQRVPDVLGVRQPVHTRRGRRECADFGEPFGCPFDRRRDA